MKNKIVLFISLFLLLLIISIFLFIKLNKKNTQEYIVTMNQINRERMTNIDAFFIYKSNGDFVKKIDLKKNNLTSIYHPKVFGDKIYYFSNIDGNVFVYELDIKSEKNKQLKFTKSINNSIMDFFVSNDNKKIAILYSDKFINIFSYGGYLKKNYNLSKSNIEFTSLKFSNDNKYLYIVVDGNLKKINVSNKKIQDIINVRNSEFIISKDEDYIAYSNNKNTVAIKNVLNNSNYSVITPFSKDSQDNINVDFRYILSNKLYFRIFRTTSDFGSMIANDYYFDLDKREIAEIKDSFLYNTISVIENNIIKRCSDEINLCIINEGNKEEENISTKKDIFIGIAKM